MNKKCYIARIIHEYNEKIDTCRYCFKDKICKLLDKKTSNTVRAYIIDKLLKFK